MRLTASPCRQGSDGLTATIALKRSGRRRQRVHRKEPTKGMARERPELLRAVLALHPRHQLGLDELQKAVGAARRRQLGIVFFVLVGRQVPCAVGVEEADDDHRRHAPVARQKLDRRHRVAELAFGVGQIQHRIRAVVALIARRRPHEDTALLAHHLRVHGEQVAHGDWRPGARGAEAPARTKRRRPARARWSCRKDYPGRDGRARQ